MFGVMLILILWFLVITLLCCDATELEIEQQLNNKNNKYKV